MEESLFPFTSIHFKKISTKNNHTNVNMFVENFSQKGTSKSVILFKSATVIRSSKSWKGKMRKTSWKRSGKVVSKPHYICTHIPNNRNGRTIAVANNRNALQIEFVLNAASYSNRKLFHSSFHSFFFLQSSEFMLKSELILTPTERWRHSTLCSNLNGSERSNVFFLLCFVFT